MKILRTANLFVLKTWLIGGKMDYNGNYAEGFHYFTKDDCNEGIRNSDGSFDLEEIKNHIIDSIDEYGDDGFNYYGDKYKFKIPNHKNLNILAKRIHAELTQYELEHKNDYYAEYEPTKETTQC